MTVKGGVIAPTTVRTIPSLFVQFVLFGLIVNSVIGSAVGLLNLLDPASPWGDYSKVVDTILVVVAAIGLLWRDRVRVTPFLALALAVVALGTGVGILSGGEPRYFISHLFSGIFIAVLYWFGYNADLRGAALERWVSRFSTWVVGAYVAVMAVFWGIFVVRGGSLFLGVAGGDLALPFVYYAVRRRWWLAALPALLVFASGKRSTSLVILFVFVLLASARFARGLTRNVALAGMILGALVIVGFASLQLVDPVLLPAGLNAIVGKWELLNPLGAEFDPGIGSSGRTAEIEWALARFVGDDWWRWIVGLGYGWSYFNGAIIPGIGTREFYSHYVHFSPLNFLFLYGLPLAVAFFVLLWGELAAAYGWILRHTGTRSIERIVAVAAVAALAQGLSGYAYGSDPLLWLLLGLATGARPSDAHPRA